MCKVFLQSEINGRFDPFSTIVNLGGESYWPPKIVIVNVRAVTLENLNFYLNFQIPKDI